MKLVSYLLNNPPIRKVVVAALAATVVFLARQLGVHVGSKEITDAISGAVPIVAAYISK